MHALIEELRKQNAAQAEQIAILIAENKLLQRKVHFLVHRLFGRTSEKLNPAQLELLLGHLSETPGDDDDPPPQPNPPRPRAPRDHKPRLPEDLPTEEVVIDPEEVHRDPNAYRCIGQEVTEELDVTPTRYFRRRIIRRKYTSKVNRDLPPVVAPLPPRLVEGGYASPGLLTDILLKKYVDHLPLHRQEQILRTRHGIELSRKTMCDWVRVVADWLTPIYRHIREELQGGGYLQVDETPVRYCGEDGGGQGYLWVFNRPGKGVLYEWYTSRAATCLEGMLKDFRGTVQSDGYGAYASYAKGREGIRLASCWAHVRRKFYEAREECPGQAGWMLHQIGLLYRIEAKLRGRGPRLRQAGRSAESALVLARIGKMLKLKTTRHRPTSGMGGAIAYTLSLWPQLLCFRDDGQLEIDNNGVENAIRPTAVGKKNWLFVGHPEAGDRSAILYTLLENCKRLGINPREYLCDVLSRLPAMTNRQTASLTPANWLAARSKIRAT
jgi:transposase